MKPVLLDSGPMIALFDGSDEFHEQAIQFIKTNHRPIVTTISNITEAIFVLDYSRKAQVDLLKWISSSSIIVETIDSEELIEITDLFEKYADVPMDFADACMVYLGDKLKTNEIATVDGDFEIYRLKGKKSFKNVLK